LVSAAAGEDVDSVPADAEGSKGEGSFDRLRYRRVSLHFGREELERTPVEHRSYLHVAQRLSGAVAEPGDDAKRLIRVDLAAARRGMSLSG
jgi:hypothetical protein